MEKELRILQTIERSNLSPSEKQVVLKKIRLIVKNQVIRFHDSCCLADAFLFGKTEEGFRYWFELSQRLGE